MVEKSSTEQLELPLGEGSPTMPHIGLTLPELALTISLCQTARDFLREKLLRGEVPEQHTQRIKSICASADVLIAKISDLFKPKGAVQ